MGQKPSNKQFSKIFDDVSENYDKITNCYAIERRKEIFSRWAKGKVLEVGAGTGEIAKHLLRKHKVIATDISPKMVQEIRRKLKIKAIVADAENLPFKNNSFDSVIASEVIYYLDHPKKFLAESYRVLKPNSFFLISSANNQAKFYDLVRGWLRKIGFGGMYFDDHIREFTTINQLKILLSAEKFKVTEEKKLIILPFQVFDNLNRILENTPLNFFAAFIMVKAQKL